MGSVANKRPNSNALDFSFVAPFLNQSAWHASVVENWGKISHFLNPHPTKIREGW